MDKQHIKKYGGVGVEIPIHRPDLVIGSLYAFYTPCFLVSSETS